MNYERNKRYFTPTSYTGAVVLLVIGVILLIIGICLACNRYLSSIGFFVIFVGVGSGIGGGVLLYFRVNNIVSDKEIDKELDDEILKTLEMIPEKLGIDLEQVNVIDPIQIKQNYLKRIGGECRTKIGKDNKFRSSNYEVVEILFSETEIYCFKRQFSLIQPEQYIETNEYHYSDIISLSTQSINAHNKEDIYINQNVDGEKFTITTSGGSSFTASRVYTNLRNPENIKNLQAFEESVQGMKQLWREKKIFA